MSGISPLRQRFIDDMNLAGLVPGTQATYIRAVLNCVQRCGIAALRLAPPGCLAGCDDFAGLFLLRKAEILGSCTDIFFLATDILCLTNMEFLLGRTS